MSAPAVDGTEVTDVDVAIERMIREELRRRFPDDTVYGGGVATVPSPRRDVALADARVEMVNPSRWPESCSRRCTGVCGWPGTSAPSPACSPG